MASEFDSLVFYIYVSKISIESRQIRYGRSDMTQSHGNPILIAFAIAVTMCRLLQLFL